MTNRELKAMSNGDLIAQWKMLSAEVRARKRAGQPKRARVVSEEERRVEREWREWRPDFCWACYRTADDWLVEWFGMAVGIERAHIVHSGTGHRVEDIRLCCALCSLCHFYSVHGNTNPNWTLPRLTQGMLLHLLAVNRPEIYDLKFIMRHNIGGLQSPCPLPQAFIEARER